MSHAALDRSVDQSTPSRRRRLRTVARRLALGVAIAVGLFVVAALATARWGDKNLWPPSPGTPTAEIFIASHGYHAGIVVPRQVLAETAQRQRLAALGKITARFADVGWLEIGWG